MTNLTLYSPSFLIIWELPEVGVLMKMTLVLMSFPQIGGTPLCTLIDTAPRRAQHHLPVSILRRLLSLFLTWPFVPAPLGDTTPFWSSALKCFSIYSITGCRPIFNFPSVTVVSPREMNVLCALCSTMSTTIGSYNMELAEWRLLCVWAWESLRMLLCFEINWALYLDTSPCLFSAIIWTRIVFGELFLTLSLSVVSFYSLHIEMKCYYIFHWPAWLIT